MKLKTPVPTFAGEYPAGMELVITAAYKNGPFVYLNLARPVICGLSAGRTTLISEEKT